MYTLVMHISEMSPVYPFSIYFRMTYSYIRYLQDDASNPGVDRNWMNRGHFKHIYD